MHVMCAYCPTVCLIKLHSEVSYQKYVATSREAMTATTVCIVRTCTVPYRECCSAAIVGYQAFHLRPGNKI